MPSTGRDRIAGEPELVPAKGMPSLVTVPHREDYKVFAPRVRDDAVRLEALELTD